MKIELQLDKSFNNSHWNNKEELKDYIEYMKLVLWDLYGDFDTNDRLTENELMRLYDILDMFEKYEIKEMKNNG